MLHKHSRRPDRRANPQTDERTILWLSWRPQICQKGQNYQAFRGGSSLSRHNTEAFSTYRPGDAFTFPSLSEGFELVVAEAMARNKPVVVSTQPSREEIVKKLRQTATKNHHTTLLLLRPAKPRGPVCGQGETIGFAQIAPFCTKNAIELHRHLFNSMQKL